MARRTIHRLLGRESILPSQAHAGLPPRVRLEPKARLLRRRPGGGKALAISYEGILSSHAFRAGDACDAGLLECVVEHGARLAAGRGPGRRRHPPEVPRAGGAGGGAGLARVPGGALLAGVGESVRAVDFDRVDACGVRARRPPAVLSVHPIDGVEAAGQGVRVRLGAVHVRREGHDCLVGVVNEELQAVEAVLRVNAVGEGQGTVPHQPHLHLQRGGEVVVAVGIRIGLALEIVHLIGRVVRAHGELAPTRLPSRALGAGPGQERLGVLVRAQRGE
mmetsp:Transcript_70023/g.221933  ORF Transcript_70023/g.221933 Transcript_70023/m.221933 type:complete len:277 (-) Transcript_70023:817-1647(-)